MIPKVFKYSLNEKTSYGIFCDSGSSGPYLDLKSVMLSYGPETDPVYIAHLRTIDILNLINEDEGFVKFLEDFCNDPARYKEAELTEGWIFRIPAEPTKIIAIARNYAEHAKESGIEVSRQPVFFAKLPSSMIAHGEAIEIPDGAGRVDHEVELAVYIGKKATKTGRDRAMDYVAGYTVFNDVTARELQAKDKVGGHPYTRAKGFDTFGPCGPFAVASRFISDPHNLDLELKINGETKQKSNTNMMIFRTDVLISYISGICSFMPGDLIATGTPEGVSPLKSGDVVTAEISGIGILENPVK
ncbi:fumarylacetoacetate hydrolase family protein [candidate division KSB1 bacterium]